jgi:hypothetical protein
MWRILSLSAKDFAIGRSSFLRMESQYSSEKANFKNWQGFKIQQFEIKLIRKHSETTGLKEPNNC